MSCYELKVKKKERKKNKNTHDLVYNYLEKKLDGRSEPEVN